MTTTQTPTSEPRVPSGITALLVVVVAAAVGLLAGSYLLSDPTATVVIVLLAALAPTALVVGAVAAGRTARTYARNLEAELARDEASVRRQATALAELLEDLSRALTSLRGMSSKAETPGFASLAQAETFIGPASRSEADVRRQVENMIVAVRIDSGTYRPRFAATDLDVLTARTIAEGTPPGLRTEIDVRPVSVWADPTAVRLVVANALQAATSRGASRVRVEVGERHGLGVLSISDDRTDHTGRGPAPDRLVCSGASLSFHIVPTLVENLGGTISEDAAADWHTTVVRIPVTTPAQAATARTTAIA